MAPSLRDLRDRRDAARFVGRAGELTVLTALLRPAPPTPVVLLHGAPGSGRSALLRELVRRAEAAGVPVRSIEGTRAVEGTPAVEGTRAVEAAVADLSALGEGLLVIDGAELLPGLDDHLRRRVLPDAPGGLRVVVSSRRPPEPAWREGAWDGVVRTLVLPPLPDADADELLRRRGVQAPADRRRLVLWARGLPAALAVGADDPAAGPDAEDRREGALLDRLVDRPTTDDDVLAAASLLPSTDGRLLAAALPGLDGDAAEAWLRGRPFVTARDGRVALDDRVRELLRRDLRRRAPVRDAALRRALADHLHDRAVLGEPWLALDLAALVDDPEARRLIALDATPAGAEAAVGRLRALVHRQLGLPAPCPTDDGPVAADVVRDALRCVHDPLALAASPLARGTTTAARAASVRRVLDDATDRAFGASAEEALHRAVLRRGYLDADAGHGRALADLHLSRSAYFRRLAVATDRVAELIVADRCPGARVGTAGVPRPRVAARPPRTRRPAPAPGRVTV